ncbi:MAG: hypothetical protein ABIQ72_09035 [Usitatibacter sp.]
MNNVTRILAAALLAVSVAACKKDPPPAPPPPAPAPAPAPAPVAAPVAVTVAHLGNAIGADKKVTTASETFAAKDTIYASVETSGTGAATLKSKWTYIAKDGKMVPVKEDSMQIQATGPAVNEFHISKPDGWPAGNYQVEIMLNDQVVQTRKYSVK